MSDKELGEILDNVWDAAEAEAEKDETEAPEERAASEEQAAPEEQTATAEPDEKLEAPEHWAPADKELFQAHDPETQQWLLEKHKEFERRVTDKFEKAGAMRRENEKLFSQAEELSEITKPIFAAYEQQGRKGQDGLREMTAWFQAITNPNPEIRKQAAVQLVTRMQIDPRELTGEGDELDDPQVKQLKQEVQQLKNYLHQNTTSAQQQAYQQQQSAMQRARQEAANEFKAFREEKDDSGYLKHPHIEDNRVQKTIGGLLQADLDLSLEDAYVTAVTRHGLSEKSPAAKIRQAKKAVGLRQKGGSVDLDNLSTAEIASHYWDQQVG